MRRGRKKKEGERGGAEGGRKKEGERHCSLSLSLSLLDEDGQTDGRIKFLYES